ncbi:bifunctional DNA-formamidopyrimidine glycosylase/DNA-(apurinic or apyrimidinic site) lyase [Nocardia cyriacigeorgica]|uniref:bifunctional DNA-formamidopyrimidine glycosylase/DNA-(apurinic or apyrimidinic site) lyase n=1 Tax=Nocardia cyriacigeorgica TaxID=135487 RepID=UPI00189496FA|nr:bifunctional DNA-formamidopyrimidine glycosylase/DNA-(apurinic or apyrimidinic site) lyase [Nocardia cyriacigeorgica]MBF6089563.1 bifunctional DNA-formamidopyrimidine glycosylase/DNA-(apurinic or apyrimidinic site) lyase [Nocardia cyriacigeorgica]MBF6094476.1 bifunctional DNA-formamidopyrimidine glycosylase/DNA-(apurinic or apyrimidinic site) lyase [Nocardia cyriacigeorgica]MBF6395884.1 bifunctional DNA-formamidopyrimidine glycosylase/DNA-(apurinic or apyrimidinic site) lyase [Nocardia cyriac
MPELPEVEVVRRGLAEHVVGQVIASVAVGHPRSVRRHLEGAADLAARLSGLRVTAAERRGKYLWLTFDDPDLALVVHLGMSGQMLIRPAEAPVEKHAHIRATLDNDAELRFVDQRTFGGWTLADLVEVDGTRVPEPVAHIARDPLDPRFVPETVVAAIRAKNTEIKRVLLDQTVVSGVGNIYADEALWRAKLHGSRIASGLSKPVLRALLTDAAAVMRDALAAGGTSFDALYVDVNGDSGYFERSLAVYGRADRPCPRCGAPIVREKFMNRSSFSCPRCQRKPRPRTR